jgi:formylglycine-generating enzyme required for sulfatase activity
VIIFYRCQEGILKEFENETLTVDERGEVIQRVVNRAQVFVEKLENDVSLEMVSIPGGMFQMGSPLRHGYEDEHPQHPVSVAPFFMSKSTINQEQWLVMMKKKLSWRFEGARRPVDSVSWNDAQDFCRRLAKKIGRAYRLPTEAEWEYACRANTATPFSFGQTLTTDLANYVGEHIFAGEPKGVYRHETTEAGSYPPNAFGLVDMHGGLWEWCADAWHDDYTGAPADGRVWESTQKEVFKVGRGGSWHEPPGNCRSAVRLKFDPAERDEFFGFRVAFSGPLQEK